MTIDPEPLPQFRGEVLVTDGGLETTLIFHHGFDLPAFAAFPLVDSDQGRRALTDYYRSYVAIARDRGIGAVLDSPTWRASVDWGRQLGYDAAAIESVNAAAIELLQGVREEAHPTTVVISGNLGPCRDGYTVTDRMTVLDAEAYHRHQVRALADAGADLVTALTMTYADEAIGVARASAAVGVPVVVSFTVETDGTLPSGQPLGAAIEQVDEATGSYPAAYGVNCAHPTHFLDTLVDAGAWVERIGLVRANASPASHAELDEAEELDDGDPAELARLSSRLKDLLPGLSVLGGCCGTDHRHIAAIADAVLGPPLAAR